MEEEAHSSDDEKDVAKQLKEIQDSQKKDLKKKRKKVMKEKRKLRDKMSLKMVIPGDQIQQTDEMELFDLKKIKSSELSTAQDEEMIEDSDKSDSDDDELPGKSRKITTAYGRHEANDRIHSSDDEASDDDDDDDDDETSEDDDDEEENKSRAKTSKKRRAESDEDEINPLVVEFESKDSRLQAKTDLWFNKEVFTGIQEPAQAELDEDLSELEWEEEDEKEEEQEEIKALEANGKRKRIPNANDTVDSDDSDDDDDDDDDSNDSNDDDDLDVDLSQRPSKRRRGSEHTLLNDAAKDGFEIVSSKPVKKMVKLTPTELAIGEELIKSNKRRRELVELSYNRYTQGAEDLPVWFSQEEARHSHKQLPITKEQVDLYKERQKAIDINPIKKVAEAAARKKKRMVKRLDKARKKAEVVTEAVDVTDKEKMKQVKEIYKKAGLLKAQKKEVSYIVAKRGVGKRVSRPPGVKGQFKVVDPRMKKDNKMKKADLKKKGKHGKGKKTGKGKKSGR